MRERLQRHVDLLNALRPFLAAHRQRAADRLIDLCQSCGELTGVLEEAVKLGRTIRARHTLWASSPAQAPIADAGPASEGDEAADDAGKEVAVMGAGFDGKEDTAFIVFLILILLLLGTDKKLV